MTGGFESRHEIRVDPVKLERIAAGDDAAEAHDAELRRAQELEFGIDLDPVRGAAGEGERPVNRSAERSDSERIQRQPDLGPGADRPGRR